MIFPQRMKHKPLSVLLTSTFLIGMAVAAERPTALPDIARFVAIDNVCAWPQLTVLRNGTIAAIIHNQPAHGLREGDVECWTSASGEFWTKAGTPTQHEPNTIRMNHASGLATNGDLIVLCSGWTNEKQAGREKQKPFRDATLRPLVCRSADGGRTWTRSAEFPVPEKSQFIPFGPIAAGEDGTLHASCYANRKAWHFRCDDDGRTWQPTSVIAEGYNETSLLHLGGKRWLAAARLDSTDLFRSEDDGATWHGPQCVTGRDEINGHLARLKESRRLLIEAGQAVENCLGHRPFGRHRGGREHRQQAPPPRQETQRVFEARGLRGLFAQAMKSISGCCPRKDSLEMPSHFLSAVA
jgi:hypothetical protein